MSKDIEKGQQEHEIGDSKTVIIFIEYSSYFTHILHLWRVSVVWGSLTIFLLQLRNQRDLKTSV